MSNALTQRVILQGLTQALHEAVDRDVSDAVYWDVYEVISGDVDWVLERTGDEAVKEDSQHPDLKDFLLEVGGTL